MLLRDPKWPPSSLASEVLALLPQRLELGLLLGDALRQAFFVRSAGIRRGLLDQLTQVAADDGDALVYVGNRRRDIGCRALGRSGAGAGGGLLFGNRRWLGFTGLLVLLGSRPPLPGPAGLLSPPPL